MNKKSLKTLLIASLILTVGNSFAEIRIEMQGTRIIGNKELPNMLYIVPWKTITPVELDVPEIDSVLDEPLQPLDRDAFRRQVNYHNNQYPEDRTNDQ